MCYASNPCKKYEIILKYSCSHQELKEPLTTQSYDCSLDDCKIKEFVPVVCPECQKNFCMRYDKQEYGLLMEVSFSNNPS